ncbi:hypothetical protein BST61_g9281 [Cercospora zeina]
MCEKSLDNIFPGNIVLRSQNLRTWLAKPSSTSLSWDFEGLRSLYDNMSSSPGMSSSKISGLNAIGTDFLATNWFFPTPTNLQENVSSHRVAKGIPSEVANNRPSRSMSKESRGRIVVAVVYEIDSSSTPRHVPALSLNLGFFLVVICMQLSYTCRDSLSTPTDPE